ncbi:MAG TPA: DUF1385 domain-containing protein [Chloroflexi bacterium]|jgi:uncharacterized protein YqhQ|nr:DUF1385 domain-containing protein [Chloroflexota bacterium]
MSNLNYGGQAVMEGVMMRGERNWAVCVRHPDGHIVTHRQSLTGALYRHPAFKWPFLRGLVMLWDSLGLGLRALMWSADVALDEEENVHFSGPLAWTTVAGSLALGIGLFFLLPMFLVSLMDRQISSGLLSNLAEGATRLAFFIAYLWGIGHIPDIRRVFAYHGAEHKTINAYEQGAPLTPKHVAKYSRAHTRCGTGFLLTVLIIFVLLSTLMGRPPFWVRILSRIVLIPVVAGISYEYIKLMARLYDKSALARALAAPGLLLQRLTTREPDEEMLEVSIASLQQVLASEGLKVENPVVVVPSSLPAQVMPSGGGASSS